MSWNQIRSKIDCIVQYLWYSTICLREAKPNHHHYHNHQKAYFHSNRHKKRAENTFSVVLTFHHFQSFGFFEALLRYPLYSWILFQELLWYKKEKLELLGKSVDRLLLVSMLDIYGFLVDSHVDLNDWGESKLVAATIPHLQSIDFLWLMVLVHLVVSEYLL